MFSLFPFFLDSNICNGAITLASTWIGAAKNVEVKSVFCPNSHQRRDELEQRQTNSTNVCGAPCRFSHGLVCLDSRNLFLFQVLRPVSRHLEEAPTQMTAMSLQMLFVKTVKA